MDRFVAQIAGRDYDRYYVNLLGENHPLLSIPNVEVVVAAESVDRGPALDIGCGRGENAVFLARCGFKVKAIDISEMAIQLAKDLAEHEGVRLDADVANIFHELLPDDFHIILNCFMLDHFPEDQGRWVIGRMQEKTKVGGVNVVSTFTRSNGKPTKFPRYYFTEEQICEMYRGWELVFRDDNPDDLLWGDDHSTGEVIKLVFKKIG